MVKLKMGVEGRGKDMGLPPQTACRLWLLSEKAGQEVATSGSGKWREGHLWSELRRL